MHWSSFPLTTESYRLYFSNFVIFFFLIFSRLFFIFSLPPPSTGVINREGNDCSGRGGCSSCRNSGAMGLCVNRRDELTADNRREEQMLTKTLSTVLMAWERSNNIFINTSLFLPCTSFALIHTLVKRSRSARTKRKSRSPTGSLWVHCFQRLCVFSGEQQSELPAIRNGILSRRQLRDPQTYQIMFCKSFTDLMKGVILGLVLAECCPE